MKKIVLILTLVFMVFSQSLLFATDIDNSDMPNMQITTNSGEELNVSSEQEELTGATEKILDNMSKKDRKIKEYTLKYNDTNFAYVAYYLDIIQLYSIPICIIGITIGAFNFYIVGEKKLDKKEQGFSMIRAFLCILVLFQVMPFLFALLVAGK